MKNCDRILTQIVSYALQNKEPMNIDIKGVDWNELHKNAFMHQVSNLIYPIVNKICTAQPIIDRWKKGTIMNSLFLLSSIRIIEDIVLLLNNKGIAVVALKGLVFKDLYPQPEMRMMCDIDILVKRDDIEKASAIIRGFGYKQKEDFGSKHIVFVHENYISIELHKSLFEHNYMKNINSFNNAIWENPIKIELRDRVTMLTLNWEMQIIYICIHILTHMVHGGLLLRQLCDLYLVVKQKNDSIDWCLLISKSIEYGIENFVFALFTLCKRIFGMEIPLELQTKLNFENEKKCIDRLLCELFSKEFENKHLSDILVKNINSKKYSSTFFKYVRIIFPSLEKLSVRSKYMYLKKYPVLLPFAWSHRLFFGIFRKDLDWKMKKLMLSDISLLKIAEEKDDIMHWFGIRK